MIRAFIGHSFLKEDKEAIDHFKEYFNSLTKSMDFQWEDAQEVQLRSLSEKVKQKMEGKNLFIGIITKKHIEIEQNKILKTKIFNKDKCIAMKGDCKFGASYWTIQESGYAIGKGMKVLFLIEDGVRELQGLHADIEYISFFKNKESDCYASLNTALGNLLREIKGIIMDSAKTEEAPIQKNEEVDKNPKEKAENTNKEKSDENEEEDEKDYYFEILVALHKKEEKKVAELKKEILEKVKGDLVKTIEWECRILHWKSKFLKNNVLGELIDFDKQLPSNPNILYWIGYEMGKYGNYEDAAEKYLASAKCEKNNSDKIHKLGNASEAYAENKESEKALNILLGELKENLPKNEQILIFKYLSESVKILKDDNLFVAFAEKALTLDPSNDSLRFDLAYKYSELGETPLSLFHYKILINSDPKSSYLNNLAVAYQKLEMPSKAVKFYKEASKNNSTISMTNLAQLFLNAGFTEEANQELNKAVNIENYEKDNVGSALARIESILKEEDEKEKKALENIDKIRQFKIDYAEAYSIFFIISKEIEGKWITHHGEFDLKLEIGNILKADREESESSPLGSVLGAYLATGTNIQTKENIKKRKIIFEGRVIRNRALEYKIKFEDESRSILNTIPDIFGVGIVDKKMNILRAMEIDKEKKANFYEFVKK